MGEGSWGVDPIPHPPGTVYVNGVRGASVRVTKFLHEGSGCKTSHLTHAQIF